MGDLRTSQRLLSVLGSIDAAALEALRDELVRMRRRLSVPNVELSVAHTLTADMLTALVREKGERASELSLLQWQGVAAGLPPPLSGATSVHAARQGGSATSPTGGAPCT